MRRRFREPGGAASPKRRPKMAAGTTVAMTTSPKLPAPMSAPPHAPISQPTEIPVMTESGAAVRPWRQRPTSPNTTAPPAAPITSVPQSSAGYTESSRA